MTPQEKLVAWLKSQVGYKASAGKHNKYAQALDKTGVYNGPKDGYDWCETFYDDGIFECFGVSTGTKMLNQPMGGCGAGCEQSAQYYRNGGQWSTSPSLGAQIYFGSVGDEYHTGGVVGYDSGYVYTVEGNVGGGAGEVAYRTHDRYGGGIAGYGIPNWSLVGGSTASDVPSSSAALAVDGDFGPYTCKALQTALQSHGYYKDYLIDGDFAYYSKCAMQEYLQETGHYRGFLADGDFAYYSKCAMQMYLASKAYYKGDVNGSMDSATVKALQTALNEGAF